MHLEGASFFFVSASGWDRPYCTKTKNTLHLSLKCSCARRPSARARKQNKVATAEKRLPFSAIPDGNLGDFY